MGVSTEAEEGKGLRRTGDGPGIFGLWGWNAEKDWTERWAGIDGFKRGDGSRGSVVEEVEASRLVFRDSGRSISPHGLGTRLRIVAITGMHNTASGDIVPVDKEKRRMASVIRRSAWRRWVVDSGKSADDEQRIRSEAKSPDQLSEEILNSSLLCSRRGGVGQEVRRAPVLHSSVQDSETLP